MIDKVIAFQQGDEEAFEEILLNFRGYLAAMSYRFFLDGMSEDDIFQTGVIGLLNAAKSFDHEKLGKFEPYATLCIKRQLYSAAKHTKRKKNAFLGVVDFEDYLDCSSSRMNPERALMCKEIKAKLASDANTILTGNERKILKYSMEYGSILNAAGKTEFTYKQMDNGLQRAKAKLRKSMREYLEI